MPKVKIDVVVDESMADQVVASIMENAGSGRIGDGKIFVLPVDQATRIRTGGNPGKNAI